MGGNTWYLRFYIARALLDCMVSTLFMKHMVSTLVIFFGPLLDCELVRRGAGGRLRPRFKGVRAHAVREALRRRGGHRRRSRSHPPQTRAEGRGVLRFLARVWYIHWLMPVARRPRRDRFGG